MATYIALLHKEDRSDYGVSFPDFPGCVTSGTTLEEARELAGEALEFHIQGMIADGEAVPEPGALDVVAERVEARDAIVFLVEVADPEPTYVRVNVTVPDAALREIDRFAEQRGISRSQLFTESALAVARGRSESVASAAKPHSGSARKARETGVRIAAMKGRLTSGREIKIHGRDGRLRDSDTVAPKEHPPRKRKRARRA